MRSVKDKHFQREVAKLLRRETRSIKIAWHKDLKQQWGKEAVIKVKLITAEESRGKDLFSQLIKLLSGDSDVAGVDHAGIIRRIHSIKYSVSDFCIEASCLEGAIIEILGRKAKVDVAEFLRMSRIISRNLSKVVVSVMKTTADSYEYSLERSGRSYCQVGADGKILFANNEMLRLLGVKSVRGRSFESYLSGENSGLIKKVLAGKKGKEPRMISIELLARKKTVPVAIELVPHYRDGHFRGGFASIIDVSAHKGLFVDVFDKSPLAITRINRKGDFLYGNQKACKMCRVDHLEGHSVRELYPDRSSWSTVSSQLKERFDKAASNKYETTLTRFNKEKFPVEITAVPDKDLQGNVTGSIAFYRDLSLERLTETIHAHIGQIKDSRHLLKAVADDITRLIPVDRFTVSIYSSDMKHVRPFFTTDKREGSERWDIRYWEMPPNVRKWLSIKHSRYIRDLDKFLAQPKWRELKGDQILGDLLERKLLSIFNCPIIIKGKLVASVAFYRKGVNAFSQNDLATIESLPLHKCVLMARYFDEKRTLEFRLHLVNDIIAVCDDLKKVADLIVRRLADHYDWQHVSIFKVDKKANKFRLLSQKASRECSDLLLEDDYTQDLDQGVLGRVYKTKKFANLSSIKKDQGLNKLYVEGFPGHVRSELCIPIMTNGDLRWLLNIEDSYENAFSKNEIEDLNVIINEVEQFLKHRHHFHVLEATLKSVSDILVTTDNTGRIQQVNEAVEILLGYTEKDLLGKSLARLFVSRAIFDKIMAKSTTSSEVEMKTKSGAAVPVLISSSQLPEELEGIVIVAKDLSMIRRIHELEYLGKMFREIAVQTKLPLSLASSWLRRLRESIIEGDAVDTLEKVMQQLHKVELTYNKLAFYDQKEGLIPCHKYLMDISEVIDHVFGKLPLTENEKIDKVVDVKLPPLRGDIFQLSFCMESILSCLLRTIPQDEKVHFRVGQESGQIVIRARGFFPLPTEKLKASPSDYLSRVAADLALGDRIIENFVRNHKGRYHKKRGKKNRIEFQIDLPIAEEYLS
ncbi:PAS domain S-box protein [Planctomycetota bacterium]